MTDEKGKFDVLVEDKGVKILIDSKALMHVIGTKMDFVDDKHRHSAILLCFIFVVVHFVKGGLGGGVGSTCMHCARADPNLAYIRFLLLLCDGSVFPHLV